jgi:hypothetical protein
MKRLQWLVFALTAVLAATVFAQEHSTPPKQGSTKASSSNADSAIAKNDAGVEMVIVPCDKPATQSKKSAGTSCSDYQYPVCAGGECIRSNDKCYGDGASKRCVCKQPQAKLNLDK